MTDDRWVLVSGDFTPLGGMDAANWGLARHLARTARVELVTHRAWPDLIEMPNLTLHAVRRPFNKHVLGEWFLNRAGRSVAAANPTARVVVNGGNCSWNDVNWVHYVHTAYASPTGLGTSRLRRWKQAWHARRSLRLEREVLTASRVVVCNSHLSARHVVELVGVPEDRVQVVYYGVDALRFGPISPSEKAAARVSLGWDDRPWVVFVGAMGDARKGFDTLYEAWKINCREATWDANLAVVGRGSAVEAWQARAKADGLADRVRFLGFRTDVPPILAAADLMVHPARYEAYGLGVQEALCRGLPVMVSAGAGIAERYPADLRELLIRDPENAVELAASLRHWHGEIEQWAARIAPFSEVLRGWTWDDMAAEFATTVSSRSLTYG